MTRDAKAESASKPRIILDTNTLVSAFIFSGATPRAVLRHALNTYQLVFSTDTWDELADVFQRDKFDAALPRAGRMRVLAELARYVDVVTVTSSITDCRDPKDNKFLALALDSGTKVIVTGDKDLLTLHSWQGVAIVSASDFLQGRGSPRYSAT